MVQKQIIPVTAVPKFTRQGGTRGSELDDVLEAVAAENPVGTPVCIRQYEKKESATGTMYNLRKRHQGDGWQFAVGPLDEVSETLKGMTGLFATRTA